MIKYNRSLLVLFSAIIFFLSFPAYSDSNSNRVFELHILPAADSSLKEIADELLAAKKTIEVVVYSISDDNVINALIDAHYNRRVDVRVILQRKVYKDEDFNVPAYKQLNAAGVQVHWAKNITQYNYTHQKSWMIDGDVAYISTGNFTDNTAHTQRNFYIKTTDEDYIKEMKKAFENDWNNPPKLIENTNMIWSPDSAVRIEDLIKSAEHEIDMYAPELAYKQIVDLLLQKAAQGVNIKIIALKSEEYDTCSSPSIKNFNTLVDKKISVYSLQNYFAHAKLIIVDRNYYNQKMFLGSQNFSVTSLNNNRELGLIITNPTIISEAYKQFDDDFNHYSKAWVVRHC